jgi:hypothetical protein
MSITVMRDLLIIRSSKSYEKEQKDEKQKDQY